jgi:hypothetical protein
MSPRDRIDRQKHGADVLERVVKGLRPAEVGQAISQATDPGGRPWFGGHIISAVQVQIVDSDG